MHTERLHITPLVDADVDALAELLWDERVYAHIGGLPASADRIALGLRRALAGPPLDRPPQQWLNYGMRLREDDTLIGRLEATVHENGIAEVAYLLAPRFWGHGYAREGLRWLHEELTRLRPDVRCWATTLPANERSRQLLLACGYERVDPSTAPALDTYDDGDWVFRFVAH